MLQGPICAAEALNDHLAGKNYKNSLCEIYRLKFDQKQVIKFSLKMLVQVQKILWQIRQKTSRRLLFQTQCECTFKMDIGHSRFIPNLISGYCSLLWPRWCKAWGSILREHCSWRDKQKEKQHLHFETNRHKNFKKLESDKFINSSAMSTASSYYIYIYYTTVFTC